MCPFTTAIVQEDAMQSGSFQLGFEALSLAEQALVEGHIEDAETLVTIAYAMFDTAAGNGTVDRVYAYDTTD
jgi:hypothetical protein